MVCVPCASFFTTRQSNDTSASISTGEPVASRVQSRDLKRASPLCAPLRSEEHTSEPQSPYDLVCRLLLEKKNRSIIASVIDDEHPGVLRITHADPPAVVDRHPCVA